MSEKRDCCKAVIYYLVAGGIRVEIQCGFHGTFQAGPVKEIKSDPPRKGEA